MCTKEWWLMFNLCKNIKNNTINNNSNNKDNTQVINIKIELNQIIEGMCKKIKKKNTPTYEGSLH